MPLTLLLLNIISDFERIAVSVYFFAPPKPSHIKYMAKQKTHEQNLQQN